MGGQRKVASCQAARHFHQQVPLITDQALDKAYGHTGDRLRVTGAASASNRSRIRKGWRDGRGIAASGLGQAAD